MLEFTPFQSALGGVLIGISSVLVLAAQGRIAGISSIVGGLLDSDREERHWRTAFLGGLLGGGALLLVLAPQVYGSGSPASLPVLALAGLCVGVGTRLGGGCTSGHGVCGISRLSGRSIAATCIFMTVAAITVFLTHHLSGA